MPLVPDPGQETIEKATTSSLFGFSFTEAVSATNTEDVTKAQAETRKLLDAANSGGFRISPEGVEPLKKALSTMHERLDLLSAQALRYLSQTPKLGSHAYGKLVAEHDRESGGGDERSATAVVGQLRRVLDHAMSALEQAARNYDEHESEAARAINSKRA